jgi:hypothetical protein
LSCPHTLAHEPGKRLYHTNAIEPVADTELSRR